MWFIKLFVSGSFLEEPFFFILIGICVSIIINKKILTLLNMRKIIQIDE